MSQPRQSRLTDAARTCWRSRRGMFLAEQEAPAFLEQSPSGAPAVSRSARSAPIT